MNITHHDIGRIALDREGDRWEILEVKHGDNVFPIVARYIDPLEMNESTFRTDGRYAIGFEDEWDLVAWEDEIAEERK